MQSELKGGLLHEPFFQRGTFGKNGYVLALVIIDRVGRKKLVYYGVSAFIY